MTLREQAAFAAGIETARQMRSPQPSPLRFETMPVSFASRPLSPRFKALADGLKATFLTPPAKPEE